MCGIYGSTIPYSNDEIAAKLKRTDFRGPDFTAFKSFQTTEDKKVILGHNRLSIIDLDARSNQPFSYEDHIHIVFNGEIYNFGELKKELEKKGFRFRTTGDTEVICAAYLAYGDQCPKYLNGMFAFVIYDAKKKVLFGARDRIGQKPFYYYHKGDKFEFSSQLSSIQLHHTDLSISESAVQKYFMWGYVPDPYSIYSEVRKLHAGHSFIYNLNTGQLEEKAFWDLDIKGEERFDGSYEDAKRQLLPLLEDAVKKRMISDVPLGIFLSGGIDSSLVASLAQKNNTNRVKTFSIKFNTKGYDESGYAEQVAAHLNTDHLTIECLVDEGLDLIRNFSHYYDEPFSDASAIPSMLLAKHTRKNVTVALSGDGGDECFLGYHRYNWIKLTRPFYSIPRGLRPVIIATLQNLPHYKSKVMAGVLKQGTLNDAYVGMVTNTDGNWFGTDEVVVEDSYLKYLYHSDKNIYERISDFDIKTFLNGDINTKVDRATMAYSLEARSPIMDHRVVEFSRALPTAYKFKSKNQKRILKDLLYEHVPKSIFERPKSGFTMPFKEWFRNELKEYVLDELNEEGLRQLPHIKPKQVLGMIDQHMDGTWNRYGFIWKLLVLKQWINKT